MGDIVNLRRFRKTRVRLEAAAAAEVNRAVFGRSKAVRAKAEAEADHASRHLDGHRRNQPAEDRAGEPPDQ